MIDRAFAGTLTDNCCGRGQASGPIAFFDPGVPAAKGALFLTRLSLMTDTVARNDLLAHAADLFDAVQEGVLKVDIRKTIPLRAPQPRTATLKPAKPPALPF